MRLVSVSVAQDDGLDSIKDWANRFGAAKPNWYVLFGSADNVRELSETLTSAPAAKGAHTPIILVGNRHTGRWHSAYGLEDPELLIAAAETTEEDSKNF